MTEHNRLEPEPRGNAKRRRKSSRYAGVSLHRPKRVFVAFAIFDGKQYHVGSFPPTPDGETGAALARDHALRLRGVLDNLNFPDDLD